MASNDTPINATNASTTSCSAEQKRILCNTLRCIPLLLLCITYMPCSLAKNGSSLLPLPMTAFTLPSQSHYLIQPRSLPLQQPAQPFNHRKSHCNSSIKEQQVTNNFNRRRNAKPITRKIKSPSNSYTQFYKEGVLVGIERTSPNSRRISGEIIMDIPINDIWNILTDYDNLSTNVPNLVESRVINNGRRIVGGRPRVYQRGAQRIFGFEFGADVTMDMTENVYYGQEDRHQKVYSVDFECVDSQFFTEFDGSWILEEYSNSKTMVRYIVDVRPEGPVPVAALEWRIKEDVPINILAVSKSARAKSAERMVREQDRRAQALEAESTQNTQPVPMSRSVPSTPKPQPSPLEQLRDEAAYNIKQTVKSVLPTPIISTAKQAIRAINNSSNSGGVPASRARVVPIMSMNDSRKGTMVNESKSRTTIKKKLNKKLSNSSSKSTFVDWYEDETMAIYLKDS